MHGLLHRTLLAILSVLAGQSIVFASAQEQKYSQQLVCGFCRQSDTHMANIGDLMSIVASYYGSFGFNNWLKARCSGSSLSWRPKLNRYSVDEVDRELIFKFLDTIVAKLAESKRQAVKRSFLTVLFQQTKRLEFSLPRQTPQLCCNYWSAWDEPVAKLAKRKSRPGVSAAKILEAWDGWDPLYVARNSFASEILELYWQSRRALVMESDGKVYAEVLVCSSSLVYCLHAEDIFSALAECVTPDQRRCSIM